MEIITMILSGLALLAAIVSLILTVQEKKRSEKQRAAMVDYIGKECEAVSAAAAKYVDKVRNEVLNDISGRLTEEELSLRENLNKEFESINKSLEFLHQKAKKAEKLEMDFGEIRKHVEDLEKGIVPDFEEAKAAAKAVDSFNRGISGILGFDPLEAAKKNREREMFGGEVE